MKKQTHSKIVILFYFYKICKEQHSPLEFMEEHLMPNETLAAKEVLQAGQAIRLYPANSGTIRLGKITETAPDCLSVTMTMTPAEYLNAPESNATFQCAVTGDNCVYRFPAIFHGSAPLPDLIWYISSPAEIERQQNRRFVRVPIPLPIRVKLTNIYGSFNNAMETTLVDISGNGVCFVSKKPAETGSKIAIEIPDLPVLGTLHTTAVVKRCAAVEVLTSCVYHIGAYLEDDMDKNTQNKLIRCVFQLQRKYLEKGMGI